MTEILKNEHMLTNAKSIIFRESSQKLHPFDVRNDTIDPSPLCVPLQILKDYTTSCYSVPYEI